MKGIDHFRAKSLLQDVTSAVLVRSHTTCTPAAGAWIQTTVDVRVQDDEVDEWNPIYLPAESEGEANSAELARAHSRDLRRPGIG